MQRLRLNGSSLLAAAILMISVAIFVNGTIFSVIGSRQIDFSINYTAGRVLHYGGNIYDRTALREEAERSGTVTIPTVYQELFATYIQPPTTAFVTYFFAFFDYETARLLWLGFTHVLFLAAYALIFTTLPRGSRSLWYFAAAAAMIANYGALYMSLSLGQVDGIVVFCLALAIWAWKRERLYLVGAAIAVAAAFKIVPALLLLYFLWKRAFRVVWGAIAAGAIIIVATAAIIGPGGVVGYVHEVVPLLLKGSVHHQNVTISAFVNRLFLEKEWLQSLSEIPNNPLARGISLVASIGLVMLVAFVTKGRRTEDGRFDREMGLVVASAILLSSIAWEFYLTWLLPSLLLLIHAKNWPESRMGATAYLGGILLSLIALSVPIGFISEPNSLFYHPSWTPGVYLEAVYLHFYSDIGRQIYIPLLRFFGLLLLCGILVVRLVEHREREEKILQRDPGTGQAAGAGSGRLAPPVVSPYHAPKDQTESIG